MTTFSYYDIINKAAKAKKVTGTRPKASVINEATAQNPKNAVQTIPTISTSFECATIPSEGAGLSSLLFIVGLPFAVLLFSNIPHFEKNSKGLEGIGTRD